MIKVTITRKQYVAPVMSASVIGNPTEGFNCVFRGDQHEALRMLEAVTAVLRYAPELPVEPEFDEEPMPMPFKEETE